MTLRILLMRPLWRILIVGLALIASVLGVCSPIFQKFFVDRLMGLPPKHIFDFLDALPTMAYLGLAIGVMILSNGFSVVSLYVGNRESVHIQKTLSDQLYDKMLSSRGDQLGGRTVGEVVSLYAVDVPGSGTLLDQTIPVGASVLFPLFLGPIALYFLAGIPIWLTAGASMAIVVFTFAFSSRQAKFFRLFKQLAADRTGLVNEWIQNIRILRILGWVGAFEKKIFTKREEETQNRLRMVTNGQFMSSISS
jgi:ATP-binding cassette subfamily B multidrug efflux pump